MLLTSKPVLIFSYAKLLAYAGQRLQDQSLIDRAWTTFNANKTGIWPDAVMVEAPDVSVSSYSVQELHKLTSLTLTGHHASPGDLCLGDQ